MVLSLHNSVKDLFIPTVKIHTYNSRSSVSNNFYIKKSKLEIEGKLFSRIGAKLWNEKKKKIRIILLNIILLESEDSYKNLESIISKVRKDSQYVAIIFVWPI